MAGAGVYRRFRLLLDVQATSRAELFGPSQRVGPHPDPLLPPAGYPDRLSYESYLPQKPRNEHLGGWRVASNARRLSEMPPLDP